MRTMTSGKGKVHHVPARNEESNGFMTGFRLYLCGRDSLNALEHEDGTPTCQGCLGRLRTDEFEARYQADLRRQRAEEAAAYERIKAREEEELAARLAARVTPAVHVVDLSPLPNYGEDHWTSGQPMHGDREPRTIYRMHSRYGRGHMRFTVLYVGPDGEARRKYQGPIMPGPYCALVPMSSVISAWAGPRENVVEVKEGDVLLLNGLPMILIDDQGMEYPHAVTPAEYGARLAYRAVQKVQAEAAQLAGEDPSKTWALGVAEAAVAVRALYHDGHSVLPYRTDAPEPVERVEFRERFLHLSTGDRLRVLGSETLAGEPGVWAETLYADGEAPTTDWWPLKYLVADEASAYVPFRAHFMYRSDGRAFEVLGSETDRVTGLRGVWVNPTDDDHPRWVAEDILVRNFSALAS
jgi:hypothetical protein